MKLLEAQATLITGASGIAAATAKLFAAQGARVVVLDKNKENLETLQRQVPQIHTLQADLLEAGTADEAVAHTIEQIGRLDILLNIAGISGRRFGDGPVHEASDEGWDMVMEVNVKTVFQMCRAALGPMMAQGSGSIVNVASVLAYSPAAEFFSTHAYAACNGARIALTLSMAAYYARYGIRVNAVAPGLIATPMSLRAQTDPRILDYLKQRQPITQKPGASEDVAEAMLYLATAPFVTGVVLEVAGGWSVAG